MSDSINSLINKFNKVAVFFIIYTLVFVVFFNTLAFTLPFVLALIFALILQKPTHFIVAKFRIKNSIASVITTFLFFTVLLTLLSVGVGIIANEAFQLGKSISNYFANNTQYFLSQLDRLTNYYKSLDPSVIKAIEDNLQGLIKNVSLTTVTAVGLIGTWSLGILASIPYILMVILFTFLATYFFTKDFSHAKYKMMHILPKDESSKISYVVHETQAMLGNYLRSYCIIITITFILTLFFFSIFHIKYSVILSVICAIFDVLPILGTGAVYLPLAVIYWISGNHVIAILLAGVYFFITLVRQFLEPKIVSSSLGLHPVAVLAALFIGLKANGFMGMIFCIFLVVFYNIFKKVNIL